MLTYSQVLFYYVNILENSFALVVPYVCVTLSESYKNPMCNVKP